MNIRQAIGSRILGFDGARAFSEMRELRATLAAGALPTGRAQRPVWGKHSLEAYDADCLRKLALIFRCVGITSTSAAKGRLHPAYLDAAGMADEDKASRVRALLLRPNPAMAQNRFLSTVVMMASMAGFVVIEKERDRAGNVIALWPLEPNRCAPILQDRAAPKWGYRIPGQRDPIVLDAANVIAYTYSDTLDLSPRGLGPVEVIFREAGLLNQMTDFLKAFFDGGAMPQHALILEGNADDERMSQEDVDAIKASWGRRYGGLRKSVEPAVLEGIKDVKRISFDLNELAYSELRDISDAAICQAFGVWPGLVGAPVGLKSSTYSNMEDARRGFYDETISALWDRLDDQLTLDLLPEFPREKPGTYLTFDTSGVRALRDDTDKRGAWAVPAVSGSAISVHTFHRLMGLPVPAGDDFYLRSIAVSALPVDDPLQLAELTPAPPSGTTPPATETKATARVVDTPPVPIAEGITPALRETSAGGSGPREKRAKHAEHNRANIVHIANRYAPKIAKYFREMKARVLDEAVRGLWTPIAGADGVIDLELRSLGTIDYEREQRRIRPYLEALYQGAGEIAYMAAADQLGLTGLVFDLANPHVGKVRDLLAQQVTKITEESKRQIQDVITNGLNDGKLINAITDDIGALFDGWTTSRAQTVARTESMLSYGHASAAGYRQSEVVDRIQCFDNLDHTDDYGAEDGLSCATRDGFVDTLDSAELHIRSEHPNGSLSLAPVVIGESV